MAEPTNDESRALNEVADEGAPSPATPSLAGKIDRRLLFASGAVAVGGIAAATVLRSRPASALPGDPEWDHWHGTGALSSGEQIQAGDLNIAGSTDGTEIVTYAPGNYAFAAKNRDTNDRGVGVYGESDGSSQSVGVYGSCDRGTGVYGKADGVTGRAFTAGVVGEGNARPGVAGFSNADTGVYGQAAGATGLFVLGGVVGDATTVAGVAGLSRDKPGVHGVSIKANAIFGDISSTSNGFNAVHGRSAGSGNGVFGEMTAPANTGNAVLGINRGAGNSVFGYKPAGVAGDAVVGSAGAGRGVYGLSSNVGVQGDGQIGVSGRSATPAALTALSSAGVLGSAATTIGVGGVSDNSFGVFGVSTNAEGVRGTSTNAPGVTGGSSTSNAIEGRVANGFNGIYGRNIGSGNGVFGEVANTAGAGNAVLAITSGIGSAVLGISSAAATGVIGRNDGAGPAMLAIITNGTNPASALRAQTNGKGTAILATNTSAATAPTVKTTSASAQPALQAIGVPVATSPTVPVAGHGEAMNVQGIATFTRSGVATVAAGKTSIVVKIPGGLSAGSNVLATMKTSTAMVIGVKSATPNVATGKVTIALSAAAPAGGIVVAWFVFG